MAPIDSVFRMNAIAVIVLGGILIPAVSVAQSQQNDEAAAIRELAERLLESSYGDASYYNPPIGAATEAPSVELAVGRLPTDPALDLPVPPGGRLIGSVVRRGGAYPLGGTQIVMDAAGTAAEITAFYERALADRGWGSGNMRMGTGGGFQQPAATRISYFCRDGENDTLSVRVQPRPQRQDILDVRISLSASPPCLTPTPPSVVGGYGYGYDSSPYMSLYQSIPALYPPEGVTLRQGGGYGGSADSYGSEARATTTMGAGDLEAFFARQLGEKGWRRLGGSSSGPITWSTWSMPGIDDAQGFLGVRELSGDQRILTIRIDTLTETQYPSSPYGTPYRGYYPYTGPVPQPTIATPRTSDQ